MTTRRHPRTLVDAWPQYYAWRGVLTHYRQPLHMRLAYWIKASAVLATVAAVGIALASRT